jgi:hypothetical protein
MLMAVPPDKKISVSKALREVREGLGLAEAKELVESAPIEFPSAWPGRCGEFPFFTTQTLVGSEAAQGQFARSFLVMLRIPSRDHWSKPRNLSRLAPKPPHATPATAITPP